MAGLVDHAHPAPAEFAQEFEITELQRCGVRRAGLLSAGMINGGGLGITGVRGNGVNTERSHPLVDEGHVAEGFGQFTRQLRMSRQPLDQFAPVCGRVLAQGDRLVDRIVTRVIRRR